MNVAHAYAQVSTAVGTPYVEHHFGWWTLLCLAAFVVANILRGVFQSHHGWLSQTIGGLFMALTILLAIGMVILFAMWVLALDGSANAV